MIQARTAAPIEQLVRKYPNLAALLDVSCPMIAVLAEKNMLLESILRLNIGSVIVFPKHNSDPIQLLVNNVVVGVGKTIKVGDHFGLHLRNVSQEAVVEAVGARPAASGSGRHAPTDPIPSITPA